MLWKQRASACEGIREGGKVLLLVILRETEHEIKTVAMFSERVWVRQDIMVPETEELCHDATSGGNRIVSTDDEHVPMRSMIDTQPGAFTRKIGNAVLLEHGCAVIDLLGVMRKDGDHMPTLRQMLCQRDKRIFTAA
jgi:hypothetical protein